MDAERTDRGRRGPPDEWLRIGREIRALLADWEAWSPERETPGDLRDRAADIVRVTGGLTDPETVKVAGSPHTANSTHISDHPSAEA